MNAAQFDPVAVRSKFFGRTLHDHLDEYAIVLSQEFVPEGLQRLLFFDIARATQFLMVLADDYFNLSNLEALARSNRTFGLPSEWTRDSDLIHQIAGWLVRGEARIYKIPPLPDFKASVEPKRPEKKREQPLMRSMFSLRVVDDATSQPITELELVVRFPGGADERSTTDSDGRIDLSGDAVGGVAVKSVLDGASIHNSFTLVGTGELSSRGEARRSKEKVSGANRFLVQLVKHRVATGDTLESIAAKYQLTADELMKFNWGTTDRAAIDKRLWLEVGCSQLGPDGHHVFDDSDEPGILNVPRPIDLKGLTWDMTHVLRVKSRVFLLSV